MVIRVPLRGHEFRATEDTEITKGHILRVLGVLRGYHLVFSVFSVATPFVSSVANRDVFMASICNQSAVNNAESRSGTSAPDASNTSRTS